MGDSKNRNVYKDTAADDFRTLIEETAEALAPELKKLALDIHDNPELGNQEFKACGWQADLLRKYKNRLRGSQTVGLRAPCKNALYGKRLCPRKDLSGGQNGHIPVHCVNDLNKPGGLCGYTGSVIQQVLPHLPRHVDVCSPADS